VAVTDVFLACRTMSFTWSSVQWLAAGMTVGLGFGLQEIFANFVSGLILLFERPIRVGDVITLGDVTGVVSDIRIRATTVTNWDRKELIVPNKDLITGRLLNWTLSDTTNRIVLKVGVAYRSDPEVARALMLEVVQRHPNVLADPAPNVTFEEFADSALNLIVRAYVSSMDVRLETIHGLHVSVHKALQEAGIEIAFPQRDITVRGIESASIPEIAHAMQKAA
jgi:potassium efflux system protein